MPTDWLKNKNKVGADTCKDNRVGKFILLYDEANDRNYKPNSYLKKNSGATTGANSNINRVNTPKYLARKLQQKFY